ncbi:uncharacterized protein A1O5_13348 [Cladophialophora psammophila CBS 110553]|uniref:Protein kinase domain-containing protein n=1 Tax=Cladophialophora psammophila CBS 110553 TaxID=1182543 RepID=W9W4A8_9EURO|nr:uncharacterized protein A1O5_13348 [Cladophialophora psammophila CBS 110553]EXJ53414.1 hypothetical protein A1O5_13348 [Cladophialophora psammophila CBS 110553]
MEGISFVTGLPGLVTACAQIYELTVTARRMGDEGVLLVYKTVIEQAKFQAWLEDAGWLSDSGPNRSLRPVMQKVVFDTLQAIKLTLKSLGGLIDKYELDEGGEVTSLHFALPDKFWKFAPSASGKSADDRSRTISRRNRIKRLLWAAGDAQLAKSPGSKWRYATSYFLNIAIQGPSQVLDDDNLKRLIEASAEGEPDLNRCAAIKKEVLDTIKGGQNPPDPKSPMRRGMATVMNKEPGALASRRLATYSPRGGSQQTVVLEDKSYASNNDGEFTEKRVQEISQILAVTPKPEKLRILDCLGYVPMRQRGCFTFIYNFPTWADPTQKPISLAEILPSGTNSLKKPPLGTRFDLARSLASSLLLLQACGILHKGLKPENIVFFRLSPKPEYDLSRPYIVGFDYARLHMTRFVSDDMELRECDLSYAHPAYNFTRSQRYVEIFDIYSLGILLLQVGLWMDLFSILKEWTEADEKEPTSRVDLQQAIIHQIRKLEPEVGEIFTRVVARCVTSDLGNEGLATEINHSAIETFLRELQIDTSKAHDEVQRNLERNIVLTLEKCIA